MYDENAFFLIIPQKNFRATMELADYLPMPFTNQMHYTKTKGYVQSLEISKIFFIL